MRAICIHEFGAPGVLRMEDIAAPVPGPSDVLIRVIAASVNPIDCKIRSGRMKDALRRPLPVVLGWDAAGIVESVGASVTRFQPGDAVYAYPEFARGGTYAEYVAVDESQVALKPRTISFAAAASLPMTAQAAWTAVISQPDRECWSTEPPVGLVRSRFNLPGNAALTSLPPPLATGLAWSDHWGRTR